MLPKTAIGMALVAIVIAIGAYLHGGGQPTKLGATSVLTSCGGNISCLLGDFWVQGNQLVTGYLAFGTNPSTAVQFQPIHQSLVSGTSTPCSIQNPLTGTSTVSFSFNIPQAGATTSAIAWSFGTSTTAFATSSTMIKNSVIPANNAGTMMWSPGVNNGLIGPGQWVLLGPDNVTVNTTGAFNSIVISGTCQAVFTSVN